MAVREFVPPLGVTGLHLDSYLGMFFPPEQAIENFGEGRKCVCGADVSIYREGCLCKVCHDFVNNFKAINDELTARHLEILEFLRVHDRKAFREWQKTKQEFEVINRQIKRSKK